MCTPVTKDQGRRTKALDALPDVELPCYKCAYVRRSSFVICHSHDLRGARVCNRFCLRQHGASRSFVCGFSAQSAEKPHTYKMEYRSAEGNKARPRNSCN